MAMAGAGTRFRETDTHTKGGTTRGGRRVLKDEGGHRFEGPRR